MTTRRCCVCSRPTSPGTNSSWPAINLQAPHEVVTLAAVTPDDRFRYILVLGLLVLMSVGIFRRLKARTGEKLDRLQEGVFILVALRVVALVDVIALAAYLLNPQNV